MSNDGSGISALASLFQRWAELCRQQADREISPALRWYLKGRADSHEMDAARAREMADPTVKGLPPKGDGLFTPAYRAVLQMMTAVQAEDATEEETGA